MQSFEVDENNANFDMGGWGVNEEYAKEISSILLTLTNGEITDEKIDVKKGKLP